MATEVSQAKITETLFDQVKIVVIDGYQVVAYGKQKTEVIVSRIIAPEQ